MLPIQKKLSTTNALINQNNIQYIIVHETDNTSKGANANAHRNAQNNGNLSGKASVHFYVDDSNIIQVIELQHGTNNCGDGANKYGINNRNTISLEICVNSDGNYEVARTNAIELVAYLKKQYPNTKIVRHYDASRKHCPRRIQDTGYWPTFLSRVDNILNSNTQNPVQPSPSPTPATNYVSIAKSYLKTELATKKVQAILNCLGWNLAIDGDCGQATATAIKDFQSKYGLTVDYKFGTQCYNKAYDLICSRLICKGSKGNEVKLIQLIVGTTADGIFGAETERKVKEFQAKNSLSADGQVGKHTWKFIIGV